MCFNHPSRTFGLLVVVLALNACGSSEFASSSAKKAPKPAAPAADLPETADATPLPETKIEGTKVTQFFLAEEYRPVDVIIALDTSGSMVQEKVALENNMQTFLDSLTQLNIDANITMMAKKTNASDPYMYGYILNMQNNGNLAVLDQYIHSNDAIGQLTKFFSGSLGYPKPLRDKSLTEAIIVSDDNGLNDPSAPYLTTGNTANEFRGPAGRDVRVSAVVGLKPGIDPNNADCEIAARGEEHIALAQKTGGDVIDLCTKDWSGLLKNLSNNIAQRRLTYPLSSDPDLELQVNVYVDGALVDPSNYTIDKTSRTLRFKVTYALNPKSEVKIEYFYSV